MAGLSILLLFFRFRIIVPLGSVSLCFRFSQVISDVSKVRSLSSPHRSNRVSGVRSKRTLYLYINVCKNTLHLFFFFVETLIRTIPISCKFDSLVCCLLSTISAGLNALGAIVQELFAFFYSCCCSFTICSLCCVVCVVCVVLLSL